MAPLLHKLFIILLLKLCIVPSHQEEDIQIHPEEEHDLHFFKDSKQGIFAFTYDDDCYVQLSTSQPEQQRGNDIEALDDNRTETETLLYVSPHTASVDEFQLEDRDGLLSYCGELEIHLVWMGNPEAVIQQLLNDHKPSPGREKRATIYRKRRTKFGRRRSQAQSQYIGFRGSKGNNRAVATSDGSAKTEVGGGHGMGQAQSQVFGDCDESGACASGQGVSSNGYGQGLQRGGQPGASLIGQGSRGQAGSRIGGIGGGGALGSGRVGYPGIQSARPGVGYPSYGQPQYGAPGYGTGVAGIPGAVPLGASNIPQGVAGQTGVRGSVPSYGQSYPSMVAPGGQGQFPSGQYFPQGGGIGTPSLAPGSFVPGTSGIGIPSGEAIQPLAGSSRPGIVQTGSRVPHPSVSGTPLRTGISQPGVYPSGVPSGSFIPGGNVPGSSAVAPAGSKLGAGHIQPQGAAFYPRGPHSIQPGGGQILQPGSYYPGDGRQLVTRGSGYHPGTYPQGSRLIPASGTSGGAPSGMGSSSLSPGIGSGRSNGGSQAKTQLSVGTGQTLASSGAQSFLGAGSSQSQVQGTYSGNGTFSAQAQGGSEGKISQSQVLGASNGAMGSSSSQAGSIGQSQSQVQIGYPSGMSAADAQSLYGRGLISSHVQASGEGGQASSQASGVASSSSQAQVGFKGKDDLAKVDVPMHEKFIGTGMASSQSGALGGHSQSQVLGKYDIGSHYASSAQAGSGAFVGSHGGVSPGSVPQAIPSSTSKPGELGFPGQRGHSLIGPSVRIPQHSPSGGQRGQPSGSSIQPTASGFGAPHHTGQIYPSNLFPQQGLIPSVGAANGAGHHAGAPNLAPVNIGRPGGDITPQFMGSPGQHSGYHIPQAQQPNILDQQPRVPSSNGHQFPVRSSPHILQPSGAHPQQQTLPGLHGQHPTLTGQNGVQGRVPNGFGADRKIPHQGSFGYPSQSIIPGNQAIPSQTRPGMQLEPAMIPVQGQKPGQGVIATPGVQQPALGAQYPQNGQGFLPSQGVQPSPSSHGLIAPSTGIGGHHKNGIQPVQNGKSRSDASGPGGNIYASAPGGQSQAQGIFIGGEGLRDGTIVKIDKSVDDFNKTRNVEPLPSGKYPFIHGVTGLPSQSTGSGMAPVTFNGPVLNPGDPIPGLPGKVIPNGFRGHVYPSGNEPFSTSSKHVVNGFNTLIKTQPGTQERPVLAAVDGSRTGPHHENGKSVHVTMSKPGDTRYYPQGTGNGIASQRLPGITPGVSGSTGDQVGASDLELPGSHVTPGVSQGSSGGQAVRGSKNGNIPHNGNGHRNGHTRGHSIEPGKNGQVRPSNNRHAHGRLVNGKIVQNGRNGNNGEIRKNGKGPHVSHTYYSSESPCGYFSFSCNIVFRSKNKVKVCKPLPIEIACCC